MLRGVNPILPLDEYIPDGEPHVFGDRIYLFGSHDTEGGTRYCSEQNYLGWSAPLADPANWRCDGEIYRANQDPDYVDGETNDLYAPDVVQGNDGRYYLYYTLNNSAGTSGHDICKVAVCDTPAGRFGYLGYVQNPDGSPHNDYLMGDPAVINDDGTIRLYFGWSISMVAAKAHAQGSGFSGEEQSKRYNAKPTGQKDAEQLPRPGSLDMNKRLAPVYVMLFNRTEQDTKDLKHPLMGANIIELADDMLTVKSDPKRIVPGQLDTPEDCSFFGHAFYEAASIRKIRGLYYFIYSSENSHELCYATSRYPDRDFCYRGTIISNGDVGFKGIKDGDRRNMTANNHGSLACINDQWYIFYHRHTHKSTFSRQACVEKVEIEADGRISQVECTSLGVSPAPLEPSGEFPAPICCVLTNGRMPHCTNTKLDMDIPYITHDGDERLITAIKDNTRIGYKYFAFTDRTKLVLKTRGDGNGRFVIATDQRQVGEIAVEGSRDWTTYQTEIEPQGIEALYFIYHGTGSVDLLSFELNSLQP